MWTQTDYDNRVTTLIGHEIRLAKVAANLRKQGDPAAFYREQEIMMLQNILFTLRDYDYSSGYLEDDELDDVYEMGLQIALNWPRE